MCKYAPLNLQVIKHCIVGHDQKYKEIIQIFILFYFF